MVFYKKQYKNDDMVKTVFSNEVEKQFNPWKNYYVLIKINDQLYFEEYKAKFRIEAKTYFEEFARLKGGKIDTFGVLK